MNRVKTGCSAPRAGGKLEALTLYLYTWATLRDAKTSPSNPHISCQSQRRTTFTYEWGQWGNFSRPDHSIFCSDRGNKN